MKTGLKLKISILFLVIGYSHISSKFDDLAVEVIAFDPKRDIATLIRPSADAYARLCHHENEVEILLVKNLYIDEHGILYGNKTDEIGHIFVRPDTHRQKLFHWMDKLEVRSKYRHQGYGKQLFYAAVNYCKKQESLSMKWIVGAHPLDYDNTEKMLTQEDLIKFYKRLGGKSTNIFDTSFSIDFSHYNA